MGHKPLWPWAAGTSLLPCRYSGSTIVTGRRRPSLQWFVVAKDTVTSAAHHYYGVY
jgi:hypothetical protein